MKLQELADLADVSPATVSRVFSHHPNVKREVRERVLALARRHRYHPRLPAKQRNVVLILPRSEIYPIRNCLEMVMMALTAVLPVRGFRIEVLPDDNLDRLESLQFCGAVAIGADPAAFKDWGVRFPPSLVLIDREAAPGSRNVFSVHSDEKQGMDLAIGCLHERGCQKIGCVIHGAPGTGNADVRRAAVLEALARRGLPAVDSLVHLCGEDAEYLEVIGRMLKLGIDGLFCPGGRAGVVIKNTFLSNTDNASVSLRKMLLESCNLHTVLDCPGGTFQGAGVKTVVLFFEKGSKTRRIWYYTLDPGATSARRTRSTTTTSPSSSRSRKPSRPPRKAGAWTSRTSTRRPGTSP